MTIQDLSFRDPKVCGVEATIVNSRGRAPRKDNVLLYGYPLGCPKPGNHKRVLPPKDHYYGVKSKNHWGLVDMGNGDVSDALGTWNSYTGNSKATQKLDYVTMNRIAVGMGVTTAKDFNRYRTEHPAKRKIAYQKCERGIVIPEGITHGKTSHELAIWSAGLSKKSAIFGDAPMQSLMTTRYQDEWITKTKEREKEARRQKRENREQQQAILRRAIEVKARTNEDTRKKQEMQSSLWRMKKFDKKAAPK
eukprot:Nk52_evm85s485 gene=Nk52_evmTU85s485